MVTRHFFTSRYATLLLSIHLPQAFVAPGLRWWREITASLRFTLSINACAQLQRRLDALALIVHSLSQCPAIFPSSVPQNHLTQIFPPGENGQRINQFSGPCEQIGDLPVSVLALLP